MKLIPREIDKLCVEQIGSLAQKRLANGLLLNHTEACALIASQLMEFIRKGCYTVADLQDLGRKMLGKIHVQKQVHHTLLYVQVEGTFRDGTKLVTVHEPIATLKGDLSLAFMGSFLPIPDNEIFLKLQELEPDIVPGELMIPQGFIAINTNRPRVSLLVTHLGDRPIQIGSHYHFIEVNASLQFDRSKSYGKRLDIPSGTAVRFEPGESKWVTLVDIDGSRIISGGNSLATGPVNTESLSQILTKLQENGFHHKEQLEVGPDPIPCRIEKKRYAQAYGPTIGDRIRLGDTELIVEIEKDFTEYGDECVFGGGKVIREGMGQMNGATDAMALDLVITNAVILDYSGIYKADIGIKNHCISAIGKAGNPHTMKNVTPGMIIGVTTEILAGEGHIIVAGGIDTHVHFICPQICTEALATGLTTLIGGGTGPNTGTNATTCTPGVTHIQMMLKATDSIPLNFGFTGKGNSSSPQGLKDQILAGAVGLKLHEDWGTTPSCIDQCLSICDEFDVQATIHTDTLNESGFVESSINAFKGRTIHTYHTEGAGGGHAPDIIKVCGELNVIPSSTNPTRPYTKNTLDEHLDMLMVCHHLKREIPEDIAFAESRIRGETIGAEDILHDMGAISIISSDSQAMGRIGEVITRTWQTADKMKKMRGHLSDSSHQKADNFRVKRYVANAIAHGISHVVGSIEVGKLADLVMYKPSFFGTKPELIMKGGVITWSLMGDANASIPTPEPMIGRPMFGSFPLVLRDTCLSFVSKGSMQSVTQLSLNKKVEAVKNCRKITKKDMKWNDFCPNISVDPETFQVKINDECLEMEPAQDLSLCQSVFLF